MRSSLTCGLWFSLKRCRLSLAHRFLDIVRSHNLPELYWENTGSTNVSWAMKKNLCILIILFCSLPQLPYYTLSANLHCKHVVMLSISVLPQFIKSQKGGLIKQYIWVRQKQLEFNLNCGDK